MKKMCLILLFLTLMLSLIACNVDEMVTIYIPETVTTYSGQNAETVSGYHLAFEKGWQRKETFKVTYEADGEKKNENVQTVVYGDHYLIEDNGFIRTETFYDPGERTVTSMTHIDVASQTNETVTTYDEHGRILIQKTTTYFEDRDDIIASDLTFAYWETEQGSEGMATQDGVIYIYCYDKEYRLVRLSQLSAADEKEFYRAEQTYDEHGNRICSEIYDNGERIGKTVVTYKAVEVSKETADRLPTFQREG